MVTALLKYSIGMTALLEYIDLYDTSLVVIITGHLGAYPLYNMFGRSFSLLASLSLSPWQLTVPQN